MRHTRCCPPEEHTRHHKQQEHTDTAQYPFQEVCIHNKLKVSSPYKTGNDTKTLQLFLIIVQES